MRSFVILEIEHGLDTDEFEPYARNLAVEFHEDDSLENMTLVDYNVVVDLPPYITARAIKGILS